MLDCKEYYFLVKEDVQILHGDKFGGQLAFYKVLLGNGCSGLYKLQSLKIQFSLWKILSQNFNSSSFSDLVHTTKISTIL